MVDTRYVPKSLYAIIHSCYITAVIVQIYRCYSAPLLPAITAARCRLTLR